MKIIEYKISRGHIDFEYFFDKYSESYKIEIYASADWEDYDPKVIIDVRPINKYFIIDKYTVQEIKQHTKCHTSFLVPICEDKQ